MYRRTFLRLAATTGTAGTAGCLTGTTGTETPIPGSRLGDVSINNEDIRAHTVEVRVTWDGDVVHDERYEVPADDQNGKDEGHVFVEPTWPATRETFTLSARMQGGEWRSISPADVDHPECLGVTIAVFPFQEISLQKLTMPSACSGR